MAARDKYLTVAKVLMREMNCARAAFKSLNVAELQERATEVDPGMHVERDEGARVMTDCLREMGLTVFPPLENAPQDGYVRIIRSGSVLANILVNLQTPGPGSDQDLALMLNALKRRDLAQDESV